MGSTCVCASVGKVRECGGCGEVWLEPRAPNLLLKHTLFLLQSQTGSVILPTCTLSHTPHTPHTLTHSPHFPHSPHSPHFPHSPHSPHCCTPPPPSHPPHPGASHRSECPLLGAPHLPGHLSGGMAVPPPSD